MFLETQTEEQINNYSRVLEALGRFSNLFSNSPVPYIVPRASENSFCWAFDAFNNARADNTADALKCQWAFGIKTFIYKRESFQKVAEFDKAQKDYRNSSIEEIVRTVADLRNKRIQLIFDTYDITNLIYHLQTRKEGLIEIYEENLDFIDLEHISKIKQNDNTISFSDRTNNYSFSLNKSTLSKKFVLEDSLLSIPVEIIDNPYPYILGMAGTHPRERSLIDITNKEDIINEIVQVSHNDISDELEEQFEELNLFTAPEKEQFVILPLYSDKMGGEVPERSGLNQWNANGRPRDIGEVYIPVPSIVVNDKFKGFFPSRDESFELKLPNGRAINAKICQENNKALMSNPNNALGEWLLRKVLRLREGELCTRKYLDELGIDSVRVTKHSNNSFSIEFAPSNSWEWFKSEYLR